MHKPTVALLSWEYFPMIEGGLGYMAKEVTDELQKQNVNVVVLVPQIPKDYELPENVISLQKGVRHYYKENPKIPGLDFNLETFRASNRKPGNVWPRMFTPRHEVQIVKRTTLYPNNTPAITRAYAYAVRDYLIEHPEVGLVLGVDWESVPSFHLIKQELKIPFVFYIHGTEYDRSPTKMGYNSRILFEMEKSSYKQADAVLSISDISKALLQKVFEVPDEKTEVIFDDIHFTPIEEGFPQLRKGKNVLFIGRVEAQKGLPFLIDTAQKVREVDPEVRFIIGGDGDGMGDVIDSIASRELERNVFFTGWIGEEEKKKLYKSTDLFVMPSPSEPFGLTALEAIRSGVPVIASTTSGFCTVVPSTPTFDYYDTNQFEQMILFYVNNKQAAKELLDKQQEELSRHSWHDQVAKLVKLIHKLTAKSSN